MKLFEEFLNEDRYSLPDEYDLAEKTIIAEIFCKIIGVPEDDFEAKDKYCNVSYWVVGENIYPTRKEAEEESDKAKKVLDKFGDKKLEKILRVDTTLAYRRVYHLLNPTFVTSGIISYRTMLRYFTSNGIDIKKELENRRGKITSKHTGIA